MLNNSICRGWLEQRTGRAPRARGTIQSGRGKAHRRVEKGPEIRGIRGYSRGSAAISVAAGFILRLCVRPNVSLARSLSRSCRLCRCAVALLSSRLPLCALFLTGFLLIFFGLFFFALLLPPRACLAPAGRDRRRLMCAVRLTCIRESRFVVICDKLDSLDWSLGAW